MIRVEPDFRSGSFRFLGSFDEVIREHVSKQFPAVGVSPRELRAPMEAVLVRELTEFLGPFVGPVRLTPEAKETWRWVQQAGLSRKDTVSASALASALISVLTRDGGLFLHQRISLDFALARPHAGLFLEMGLGKTRVSLLAARERCRDERGHMLVVCPRAVISTWRDEAAKWLQWGTDEGENVFLVRGTKRQKLTAWQAATAFMAAEWTDADEAHLPALVVTNYDTLLDPVLVRAFARAKWSAICFDESTYLKNHRAQRSRFAWRSFRAAPHRMILTGEPVTQGPEDLFSQMRVLDEEVLGTRIASFRERYCVVEPRRFGPQRFNEVVGYRNLDDLGRRIYRTCIQFQKHECLDLPAKTYTTREVEMTPQQAALYKEMCDDFVGWLRTAEGAHEVLAHGALPRIGKLQQITSGFCYVEGDGRKAIRLDRSPKMDALAEIVEELALRRKVICWCCYQEEVDWATETVRAAIVHQTRGLWPVVAVDGRVSDEVREERLTRFRDDLDCRVLVAQIASLGHGVNLQSASASIYVSNPWSYEQRLQSEARTHRIGQQNQCLYVDLVCPGTVDVSVLDALQRKSSLSELVTMKQWERFARGELDGSS